MTCTDFKGRLYKVIDLSNRGTLLECVKTGDRILILNQCWADIGFNRP